jgi:hypothetical protein
MSKRSKRWLLAGLTFTVVAVGLVVWLLLPAESAAEAAARRVPVGADRAAVEAAVGRPADEVDAEAGRVKLTWYFGDDQLWVEFDDAGRSARATFLVIHTPLWDRLWSLVAPD